MFSFPGLRTHRRSAIEAEMDNLRRQISGLSARASRMGSHAYRNTSRSLPDLYEEVSGFLHDALPLSRHDRHCVERMAREHPYTTTALAGLVLLGLVATLLYTRR